MIGRLLALVLPPSVLAIVLVVLGGLRARGTISEPVWYWTWPTLVALLFLALFIGLVVVKAKRWALPALLGFVAQLVGILLLLFDVLSPRETLFYSLGAFLLTLLVLGSIWLVATLRTRWLERSMVRGMEAEGVDPQSLERIRKDMMDALALLRKAGRGRNAVYEMPWFLVMGRPQAGKTVAIKNSGLSLPVRKDWVKGVGGTFTADWFFTNEMIFLDTPGKWVVEGATEEGSRLWVQLLRLLRKYRGRRPLDGIVVVVPADDLLSKTRDELFEQAANIREVIDLIHDELKFRFPVYVLVSKADLVEGFVDFFKGLPANRKHQVFGWSHPDPNDRAAVGALRKGFRRVLRRMAAYRLEILARTASRTTARRLFFFTEEFKRLDEPLHEFADALFQSDPYHETPVFRGFYFTSGTQGEGSPLGQAMNELARTLGIRAAAPAAAEQEEPKRSYFLLELFRELMVGDEGLVGRTARHWWRRRRDTVFAAFLPAVVAATVLLFSAFAYLANRSTYRHAETRIPEIVRELESLAGDGNYAELPAVLDRLEEIRDFHRKMTGFNPFRRFFMRHPGDLDDQVLRILREATERTVLEPTLRDAEAYLGQEHAGCVARVDVFYAVVWLSRAPRYQGDKDLRGLEQLWSELDQEGRREAGDRLRELVRYMNQSGSTAALLPGLPLAKMAADVRNACGQGGAGTALDLYWTFQQKCAEPRSVPEIEECNEILRRVASFRTEDRARLDGQIDSVKRILQAVPKGSVGEDQVSQALGEFGRIGVGGSAAGACASGFDDRVLVLLDAWVGRQDGLVDSCAESVSRGRRDGAGVNKVILEQAAERRETELQSRMEELDATADCQGFTQGRGLRAEPIFRVDEKYRLVQCLRRIGIAPESLLGGARPPTPPPGVPRPAAARRERSVPAPPRSTYLAVPAVPGAYSAAAVEARVDEWRMKEEFFRSDAVASAAETDARIRDLKRGVERYAEEMEREWRRYAGGIRLRTAGSVASWLSDLATTKEFRQALDPLVDAWRAAGSNAYERQFDPMVRGLKSVVEFSDQKLPQYQSMLERIAGDLRRAEQNSSALAEYRNGLRAESPQNSLIQAEGWVRDEAGVGLAQGVLTPVLRAPLEAVRKHLSSPDLTLAQWAEMVEVSRRLAAAFPFGGMSETAAPDPEDVRVLFGRKSGHATVMARQIDELGLERSARAWVLAAAGYGPAFFDADSDELRPYPLSVKLEDWAVEPEKEGKNLRLQELRITDLGGKSFAWDASKSVPSDPSSFELDLFEAHRTGSSILRIVMGKEKMIGSKFKDTEPQEIGASGTWAPFRLFGRAAEKEVLDTRVGRVRLRYVFPLDPEKPEKASVIVHLQVEGPALGSILAANFGEAPRRASGE